ncbi:syncephapepsin precursor [Gongronella butleri]|nr:syncephapepsin precursor [Gongronella butleri]
MKTILTAVVLSAVSLVCAAPVESHSGFAVQLQRNENYQRNATRALYKVGLKYPAHFSFHWPWDKPSGGSSSPSSTSSASGSSSKGSNGNVPIVDDNDVEYYGTIGVGTPAQDLALIFDTGSADLWFASTNCMMCGSNAKFASGQSSTYDRSGGLFFPERWSISYGDGSTAKGIVGTDTVSIGGLTVEKQAVQLATSESSSFRQGKTSGIMGLGFDNLASVKGTVTPFHNMIKQNLVKKPIFGVYLGRQSKQGGGEYVFGGYNKAHFTGSLKSVPVDNSQGFWGVTVDSITANGKSAGSDLQAIVDTGTSLVVMPQKQADEVAAAYGATANKDGTYTIDCDTSKFKPWQFKLAGHNFQVAAEDMIYAQSGKQCIAGFAASDTQFTILGDTFIKNNYVVFNYEKPEIQMAPIKD